MRLRATILMLVGLALPAGAQPWANNPITRATPVVMTNIIRSIAGTNAWSLPVQTNISYTSVTNAPWQWGTINGTNWSLLSTSVLSGFQWGSENLTNLSAVGLGLTNLLKVHELVPGDNITMETNGGVWTIHASATPGLTYVTNTVWTRLTNYEQTLYIDYAHLDGTNTTFYDTYQGLSNQWFSFTASTNTTLKVELENTWRNEEDTSFGTDSKGYLWGSWETPNYTPVLFNFVENLAEKASEIDLAMVNFESGPIYTFEDDDATFQSAGVARSVPITIRAGTTLRLYQGWELSREIGNPGATNYFVGSVWVQSDQRFIAIP